MLKQILPIGLLATTVGFAHGGDTIPELATASGRLDTLVSVVVAADLAGALSGEGPFTVFAPTDEAFSRLDAKTVNALLEEPGRGTLKRILTHHVVPGRLEARDLVEMDSVVTLAGTTLELSPFNGRLLVDKSVVETADINASNGVVHLIDRVLMPPPLAKPLEQLLFAAIDRGVPLYNDGSPEACCAVYATALEALVLTDGWNLSENRTANLKTAITNANEMTDQRERAWTLRRIIDALLMDDQMKATNAPNPTGDASEQAVKVYNFENSRQAGSWQIVLDGVMGGLSTGNIETTNGTMIFSGETSLRNNGGFSSMRAPVEKGIFKNSDSIKIRVKGDGRTWILGTRKGAGRMGGDSFWTRFDTKDGEWMTVTIPIDGMERHYFGQKMSGTITPEEVGALEFYMYDKKTGPFRLEIESIEGVKDVI
jgi:hypothetical protein